MYWYSRYYISWNWCIGTVGTISVGIDVLVQSVLYQLLELMYWYSRYYNWYFNISRKPDICQTNTTIGHILVRFNIAHNDDVVLCRFELTLYHMYLRSVSILYSHYRRMMLLYESTWSGGLNLLNISCIKDVLLYS